VPQRSPHTRQRQSEREPAGALFSGINDEIAAMRPTDFAGQTQPQTAAVDATVS